MNPLSSACVLRSFVVVVPTVVITSWWVGEVAQYQGVQFSSVQWVHLFTEPADYEFDPRGGNPFISIKISRAPGKHISFWGCCFISQLKWNSSESNFRSRTERFSLRIVILIPNKFCKIPQTFFPRKSISCYLKPNHRPLFVHSHEDYSVRFNPVVFTRRNPSILLPVPLSASSCAGDAQHQFSWLIHMPGFCVINVCVNNTHENMVIKMLIHTGKTWNI